MRNFFLIFSFLWFYGLTAVAQENYENYDEFNITDDDLNVFDLEYDAGGGNSLAAPEPGDFPASQQDDFNYGGVDNFADDEAGLNFGDEEDGELNFGDDENVGQQIEPKQKKKKKKKPAQKQQAQKADSGPAPVESAPDVAADLTGPTLSDTSDSGSAEAFDVEAVASPEVPDNYSAPLVGPTAVNEYQPEESPYAPLPEDTMAPPAPDLPEPNEFAGAPAVPGTRRIMAIGEAPETYRVRAGDTLYDISDQLLDEPNYWPKLWALNPEIRNPHFIYPGIVLRFYPGDEELPPYLQVVREQDVVPIDSSGVSGGELVSADVDALLLEQYIPAVSPVEDAENSDVSSFNLELVGNETRGETIGVIVPAFYFAEEQEGLGVVAGNREGWHLSGDKDFFLIESEAGLSPGTIYTVVRPSEVPEIEDYDEELGYRYEFVAAAKVTRSLGEEFTEATVVYTRLGVKTGDILINYKTFKRNLSIMNSGVSGSGVGTVIGFEHPQQMMGGQGSLIFLSGSFSSNSVVPIFNDARYLRHSEFADDYPETVRPVATVRIIEATEGASLGYIMNNTKAVRLGDFSGRG